MAASTAPDKTPETEPTPGGLRRDAVRHCGWCGKRLEVGGTIGRKRRYCGQACRQRAYERRSAIQRTGLPADAVVFSTEEVAIIQDRMFQLRCAAEDILTATREGSSPAELTAIATEIATIARNLEQLR